MSTPGYNDIFRNIEELREVQQKLGENIKKKKEALPDQNTMTKISQATNNNVNSKSRR